MRKFLIVLVLILGGLFIYNHIPNIEEVITPLQQGDWRFITLGITAEALWFLVIACEFWAVSLSLGVRKKLFNLIPVMAASNFVSTVAPSGGMSGIAIFLDDAHKNEQPLGRVTAAGALFFMFEYVGLVVFLSLGLVALAGENGLNPAIMTASSIFFFIVIALAVLLFLGSRSGTALGGALAWLTRLVNRVLYPILRREYLSESSAHHIAHDIANGLMEARKYPQYLVLAFVLAIASKVTMLLIFILMFLAFNVPMTVSAVIAGFSVAYLFIIISPTPHGIGFVEVILPFVLESMGIALGAATVVTLSYRAITFWIDLLFGMIAFRYVSSDKRN
jgi:uncharacterized protein (TIRG00374 family)